MDTKKSTSIEGGRIAYPSLNNKSILYVTNIRTPYRAKIIEAWIDLLSINIEVCYTDSGDQNRGWQTRPVRGASETILPQFLDLHRYGKLNLGLWSAVSRSDVLIIGGFEQASYLMAALIARAQGKPVILLFDGYSPHRFGKDNLIVSSIKKFTASLCKKFFANGRVGAQFLISQCGVRPQDIYNQRLSSGFDRNIYGDLDQVRKATREKYFPGTDVPILSFVGYFIHRKRADLIIKALSQFPEDARPHLMLVGTGPLQEYLSDLAVRLGVQVKFVGFRSDDDLAELFIASDLVVLPSDDDPWGLVVNEALSVGTPVVTSDACGSAWDLIFSGITGATFKAGSVEDLVRAIEIALSIPIADVRRASSALLEAWKPSESACELGRCLSAALEKVKS